ncbi:hypothetical protein C8J28_1435 [Cereibacter azotoformans]|uniref:Uncharacterized protein n=1 Tax=Cereibacter azotoformans TaxID=43057 RepID=A0A2T5JKT8_9RHOB|nr:hypothetical protein C8J28_1435 [Cereibacter azotoformans]
MSSFPLYVIANYGLGSCLLYRVVRKLSTHD